MTKQPAVERFFMTLWLRRLGFCLSVVAMLFVFWNIFKDRSNIPFINIALPALVALSAGIIVSILSTLILSQAWRQIVNIEKPFVTIAQSFAIYAKDHIGKLEITKNVQFIKRKKIATVVGMTNEFVATTMTIEVLALAIAAVAASLPGLLIYSPRMFDFLSENLGIGIFVFFCLLMFIFAVYLLSTKFKHFFVRIKPFLNSSVLFKVFILNFTFFILSAYTASILTDNLWIKSISINWSGFVPGIALAWLIGFMTPGSPRGLGIRELVLMSIYAPEMGVGLAAATAILLRILNLAGEYLVFSLSERLNPTN